MSLTKAGSFQIWLKALNEEATEAEGQLMVQEMMGLRDGFATSGAVVKRRTEKRIAARKAAEVQP